jgi:all-trans-retinol dehydrogenase (NAD+)
MLDGTVTLVCFLLVVLTGLSIVYYSTWCKRRRLELHGRAVLITGAASGLGLGLATACALEAAAVILVDIDAKGLARAEATIQAAVRSTRTLSTEVQVLSFVCDVSDRAAVRQIQQQISTELEPLFVSVLFNNAGVLSGAGILDITQEQAARTFGVNSMAHLWTVQAFLPAMLQHEDGMVVTIASVMGLLPGARLADYCASKAASLTLHESLRMELRRLGARGIDTTLVCPYIIDTGMFEGALKGASQTRLTKFVVRWIFPYIATQSAVQSILAGEEHGLQRSCDCAVVNLNHALYAVSRRL